MCVAILQLCFNNNKHFDRNANGGVASLEGKKTALKRQITPEGKAPGKLKAERTSVREHFNALGNTAIGCEVVL
jgi:hypothetical protein